MFHPRPLFLGALALVAGVAEGSSAGEPKPVNFLRDIRPILANNCFTCHGPDEAQRQTDFRLDVAESALDSVIVAGDPDASELLARVTSDDADLVMPPSDSGRPALSADQVALLRRWIAEGAKFEIHWAYQTPQRPAVPEPQPGEWALGAIDRFVAAAQAEHGLTPAPPADRRTLLRRLSFDLVGLPPTPAEIESLENDPSPDAYEKAVDRLLASPHYGERMAVYWLDVARYADSGGYHSDNDRAVWLWRDYVIRAFNENLPFDRFVTEQLAGDLLEGATRWQRIASGYNRLLQTTEEGGAQPKEYTAKYASDRVRNTASAFLGATMMCAECHTHKYDPYTAKDFYSFAAFFADVGEKAVGRQDQTPLPTEEQSAELARLDAQMAPLRETLASPTPEIDEVRRQLAQLEAQKKQLEAQIPTSLVTTAVPPRTVRVLPRGNWLDDSGPEVQPAIPEFLGKLSVGDRRATRLDLARWLTARDNPLVARVFVNRLWKLFFGRGIVGTVDDLGTQGDYPTHPELLDWLAVELIESGWDVKHMVRLMVTSQTYRQSSRPHGNQPQRDPQNRFLARQNRFRLGAEFIRDNALAVSGLLAPAVGGPSVKPYQPAGYWQHLNFPKREWESEKGENQYRRGLYTWWQRTFLHPSLLAFDASTREECTAARARSNTPLQSLVLLNDPTYVEAARALAARVLREGGGSDAERLEFACRAVLGRPPAPAEADLLTALVARHREEYGGDEAAAAALASVGNLPVPDGLSKPELAAWTSVARTLLNLHETITRE